MNYIGQLYIGSEFNYNQRSASDIWKNSKVDL